MPLPLNASRTPQAWFWAWTLAMVLVLLRLGFVLGHQPLAGFANQFDMLRTTACLGLAADDVAEPGAATPAAPITHYRVDQPRTSSCLYGTEVAISALALSFDAFGDRLGLGDPQRLSLRLVACTKALLLLLAMLWVDRALRASPRVRLGHAWCAALLLVDPVNTLYLAGFYTEFVALLSAYLAVALPLVWLLQRRPPAVRHLLAWGVVLAALALSRFQHVLIPPLLLLCLLLQAQRQRWSLPRLLYWPALILLPALALQLSVQGQYQTIADANRWNSFFGAALPASADPARFVAELGLPAACAELVHTTWYLPRGRDARQDCPQAFDLSRLRWSAQLLTEPTAVLRLLARGVALSGQSRPSYLGELAGQTWQRLPSGPLALGSSFADALARLPFVALLAFWCWPVAFALAVLLRRQRPAAVLPGEAFVSRDAQTVFAWLGPVLAGIVVLGWASSVLGDGYSELARHLHLAANASLLALLCSVYAALHALWLRHSPWSMSMRWMFALGLVCSAALGAWINAQALGFGVLDQPADERRSASMTLSGWAIDPRGIAAVVVLDAEGQRQALSLSPRPDLLGIFGSGVGQHGVGFSGQMELSDGPAAIAIEVVPKHGAATIIDRRWLR